MMDESGAIRQKGVIRWCIALVAFFFAVSPLVSSQAFAKTFVLSIGNNRGRAQEQQLLYAQKDASEVAAVFQRFGDTQGENSVLLLGQSSDRVLESLRFITSRAEALSEKERARSKVIVYYSGHADSQGLHLGDSSIEYHRLRAIIQKIPVAVRVLVVDGCRSGGLTRVKGAKTAEPFKIAQENKLNSTGFVMISSSTANEDSHESDQLQGSFFTHHFVNALRGVADFNNDGGISLSESYAYAYHQTLRSSGATMSLQHPTLENRLRGRGDLILSNPSHAAGSTATLVLDRPAVYLVAQDNHGGNVVAEVQTHRFGQKISLGPGKYQVQQREQLEYRNYHFVLKAGQTHKLEREDAEVEAYAELVRKGGPKKSSNTAIFTLGARGPIVHQSMFLPQLGLGYQLHLKHFSLGFRGRTGFGSFFHRVPAIGMATREVEVGFAVALERYVDLRRMSFAFGLWAEAIYFHQRSYAEHKETRRNSLGGAFGGTFALQFPIGGRSLLRLEGGPMTYIRKQALFQKGVETGSKTRTSLTGVLNLGFAYQF